jgi:hypothetical protein
MKYNIKCTICNETNKVNGQKQIENFGANHKHDLEDWKFKTGMHLELKEVTTKELFTGSHTQPVHDYWRKVKGSM